MFGNSGFCLKIYFFCMLVSLAGCDEGIRIAGQSQDTKLYDLKWQALAIIQQALADKNPRVRVKAIEVVADARLTDQMSGVVELLTDDFVPVRYAAALAVGDLKYEKVRKRTEQLLNAPDENVRIAAAYALGKLGSVGNFRIIEDSITSRDQTVRANAAVLLGKSGDKNSLDALYRCMKAEDSDKKSSLQAAEAIARLGDESIYPRLWTMLISVYTFDRVMGVKAMGALGTVEAQNALTTMLKDDTQEVRLIAAEQLGRLGDSSGQEYVLEVLTKKAKPDLGKEDSESIKVLAALAIGAIKTPQLTKFLPKLLNDKSKFVRIAAAKAVFMCTEQHNKAGK